MSDPRARVVTIDGPSGSGKGTISRGLAARLGWHLLDSGALYRLVAIAATRRGVALDDAAALAAVARVMEVHFGAAHEAERVSLGRDDVTARQDGPQERDRLARRGPNRQTRGVDVRRLDMTAHERTRRERLGIERRECLVSCDRRRAVDELDLEPRAFGEAFRELVIE